MASQEERTRSGLPVYLRQALATPRWIPIPTEPYEQFWTFITPSGNEEMDLRRAVRARGVTDEKFYEDLQQMYQWLDVT